MSADNVKGPWSLHFEFDGWKSVRTIRNSSGNEIMCDTPYYPWCPDTDDEWRLIAVAPEMLEALQAISSEFIDPLEPSGPDLELPRDWLFRVREVIAKATGEQDTGRESNGRPCSKEKSGHG